MTSNVNPLLARIQKAQGAQRRVLMAHRKRFESVADAGATQGEGGKVAPDSKPSLMVSVPYGQDSTGGELINANVMFAALLEPIGKHMGCTAEDVDWMRENWGKGDELVNTLIDWSTKVILYPESIQVNDDLKACCHRVMQAGGAVLSLEAPSEPKAARTEAQEATPFNDDDLELDASLYASESDAQEYSGEATVDQNWDRPKGMRGA